MADFDTTAINASLDQADQEYHALFDGHVPEQVPRFDVFLSQVRMIVDQSADSASKEEIV